MKRAWTKSLRLASAAACGLALLAAGALAQPGVAGWRAERHNELTLARLHPGRDALATAILMYGPRYRRAVPDYDDVVAWVDPHGQRVLQVEVNEEGVIDSVTLASLDPLLKESGGATANLPQRALATGRGLALGDTKARVLQLYGRPANSGPSTMEGRELEFLFYAFDWAGPEVPQVMEITCERATGRVVKITLAFPSL